MPYRKDPLITGEIYHIFSKSIGGRRIFGSRPNLNRMEKTLQFYVLKNPHSKLFLFLAQKKKKTSPSFFQLDGGKKLVKIIAYCLMPTHIHLALQQLEDGGISKYMNLILHSYSNYFNLKYKRKGPLWEGRFKSVLVKDEQQLIHLTRYIHLNPVTAYLVNHPQDWRYSSYKEYLGITSKKERICDYSEFLDIEKTSYQRFVKDQIEYQRELRIIKNITLE